MATCDLMYPREASKYIAEHSKHVTIPKIGVQHAAEKMLELLKENPRALRVDRWDLHVLNPTTKDQTAVDWVFVADVLNFSFWSDDESLKYTVTYKDESWTGYWSLCAAMNRALDEGVPLLDPKFYSTVSLEQLHHIFRSDTPVAMPMMEERLHHLHEAGKVLIEKYDGTFLNVVKSAKRSAQQLLRTVVEDFPSFRDTAEFAGKKVALYKRVQILIGDIWAACAGTGNGEFTDIDTITMFADYRIPQALVWFGAMQYSQELTAKLNISHMFQSGEVEEVEIRGCSIWAVEMIVQELKVLIGADPDIPSDTHINAIILDHYLWDYRRLHADQVRHIPIHKTRCVFY